MKVHGACYYLKRFYVENLIRFCSINITVTSFHGTISILLILSGPNNFPAFSAYFFGIFWDYKIANVAQNGKSFFKFFLI